MGREGVYLGDAGHEGDHGAADAAAAADQVAVLEGVLDQLLGGHVDDVIVVVQDGVQLDVDALLHQGRRGLAVDAVHLGVDQVPELLGGVLDLRREEVLGQELDLLRHVGDGPGVLHDHLVGGLLAEVVKLLQHLVRGAEVDRAGAVRVGELLGRLEDAAVLLVLGVEEVDVGGGHHGFSHGAAQVQDAAVEVLQDLHGADAALVHEEAVVGKGLDLEIVIEGRDFPELRVALAPHHGAVELAHAAGRAHEETLAAAEQEALGDARGAVEIAEIGLGDHLVEVLEPAAVEDQEDHMVGLLHVAALEGAVDGLDVVEGLRALRPELRQELVHDARHDHGIVRGAVVVELGEVQAVGDDVQLEALQVWEERLAQGQGVQEDRVKVQAAAPGRGTHEAGVEVGVVSDQGAGAGIVQEALQGLLLAGGAGYVRVGNARELGDVGRDRNAGVHEGIKGREDLAAAEDHGADLGHAVELGVEAGGLDVEGDELGVQGQVGLADDRGVAVHVVVVIGLEAVDDLDPGVLPRLPHVREGLGHAVVRYRDGGHAPGGGAFHHGLRVRQGVHGREAGMQVELHALVLGRGPVRAELLLRFHDVARVQDHVVVELGVVHLALDQEMVPDVHAAQDRLVILGTQVARDPDGVGPVGNIKGQDRGAAFRELPRGDREDVALHGDAAGLEGQGLHLHGALADGPAHEDVAVGGGGGLVQGVRGRGDRRRVVRVQLDAAQGVVVLQAPAKGVQVHGGRHRGEASADRKAALRDAHPDVGHKGPVQAAAAVPQVRAAGEDCEKGGVVRHRQW